MTLEQQLVTFKQMQPGTLWSTHYPSLGLTFYHLVIGEGGSATFPTKRTVQYVVKQGSSQVTAQRLTLASLKRKHYPVSQDSEESRTVLAAMTVGTTATEWLSQQTLWPQAVHKLITTAIALAKQSHKSVQSNQKDKPNQKDT